MSAFLTTPAFWLVQNLFSKKDSEQVGMTHKKIGDNTLADSL